MTIPQKNKEKPKKQEKKVKHEHEKEKKQNNPPEQKPSTEEDIKTQAQTKQDMSELQKKLNEISKEKDKYYQNYLRSLADQENMKKRYAREKEESAKYSHESLFKEFLPLLDSIEKATDEIGELPKEAKQLKAIKEGFDLVAKKLQQILEDNGLASINARGVSYDPNLHQAVQTEKSKEIKEATIKEEFMKGYQLNGRLLRPSMVSVLIPEDSDESKDT